MRDRVTCVSSDLDRLGMREWMTACLVTGLILIGAAAEAQSTIEVRTLARKSGVAGVPDVTIDLDAPASQKYAVVIGNSNYEHVPGLKNAARDAEIVADYLRSEGYSVSVLYDLDKRGFEESLRRIIFDVESGAEVVFYFAGHGIQIGQTNYLIPADAELDSAYDVPFEAVSLPSVMSIIGARTRSLIAILDSCRDNPFSGQEGVTSLQDLAFQTRAGFSPQNTPINSLLVFSTAPGAVAYDGEGENSPFTEALVEVSTQFPDRPVDEVMKEVRRRVYQSTSGLQIPWESSSLVEPVFFRDQALGDQIPVAQSETSGSGQQLPEEVSIEVALSPTVNIGGPLEQVFQSAPQGSVAVKRMPKLGRVAFLSAGATRGLSLVTLTAGGIGQLVYRSQLPQQSATKLESLTISDDFEMDVNGSVSEVQLQLQVDPCDFHAGDFLDPEGVGIARYPNEIEPAASLRVCREAVENNPDVGRFHYQLGRVHVAMRDLDAAEEAYQKARELGHTRAWNGLGTLEIAKLQQTGGSLRELAPDIALSYFAAGVERGDPYAIHSLGRQLLLFGESERERSQGFELLSRSLELGHTFSMNTLGVYFIEEGTEYYNPERGLRYLQESAARNDIYGFQNMGFVTLNGLGGLEKDPAAAYEWFRKASIEGHPTAPSSIGRMYANGQTDGGVDHGKAIEWYDIGLARGDPWGGTNAAWIILNRTPPGYGAGEAAKRAAKAAQLRNPETRKVAEELLGSMSNAEIDAGTRALAEEFGVNADGDTDALVAAVSAEYGRQITGQGVDRLRDLAKLFWENSLLRSDLY